MNCINAKRISRTHETFLECAYLSLNCVEKSGIILKKS